MKELKIGGIYTEEENEFVYVIFENRETNYYVLQCRFTVTSRKEMIDILNLRIKHNNFTNCRFCHTKKNSGLVLQDMDGYLGKIPEEIFDYFMDILKQQIWYGKY